MTQILEDKPQVSPSQSKSPPKPSQFFKLPTPPQIGSTVLAVAIIGLFFAPWFQFSDGNVSAFKLQRLSSTARILWLIPILAIATVATHSNDSARRRLGTITGAVAWLGVFHASGVITAAGFLAFPAMRWGASTTLLLGLVLFVRSGKGRVTAPVDLVAKKLGSRKAEIYSHWGTMTPEMHFSTQDFYTQLEAAVRAKEWPGVQLLRIIYTEAGILSHKREYLRVIRHRQLFDVCAATFGRDYFFSIREAEIPSVVTVRMFLAVLFGAVTLNVFFMQLFGAILGQFAMLFFLIFAVWFLFNVLKLGLSKVDALLMQTPVFGTIYEAWFRKDTYFQQDSRLVFLQSVTELVKEHVEETVSDKGLTFLSCFEKQPILERIYKRFRVSLQEETLAARP